MNLTEQEKVAGAIHVAVLCAIKDAFEKDTYRSRRRQALQGLPGCRKGYPRVESPGFSRGHVRLANTFRGGMKRAVRVN